LPRGADFFLRGDAVRFLPDVVGAIVFFFELALRATVDFFREGFPAEALAADFFLVSVFVASFRFVDDLPALVVFFLLVFFLLVFFLLVFFALVFFLLSFFLLVTFFLLATRFLPAFVAFRAAGRLRAL
jgi:hypothetical protein